MKDNNLSFQEIFNSPGLYVADSFAQGVCFEIDKSDLLLLVTYSDKNDLLPHKENAIVYKELFNKTYNKVYTRQSLFKE